MKKIIIATSLLLCGIAASAQTINTNYFLDNYIYGYRFNPSIQPQKSFFGILVSNVTISTTSNSGISSFVYPVGNTLVTGLNENVPSSTFLGNLADNTHICTFADLNLISVGFRTKNAYHTIEINAKSSSYANVSKDLFAFLKNGTSANGSQYDFTGTSVNTKNWTEVAYGYSREIGDKIVVGGRVKALIGLASASLSNKNFTLDANPSQWTITSDTQMQVALQGLGVPVKPGTDVYDFSGQGVNFSNNYGPCGFGASVDLGVTWKPIKGLSATLAILDLGAIRWNYGVNGTTTGTPVVFTGVGEIDLTNPKINTDDLSKQLASAVEFHSQGAQNAFEMVPFTANAGVRYKIEQTKNMLAVGASASYYHFTKYCDSFDARAGLTFTPIRWFSLAGSFGGGSYGLNYGVALSLAIGPVAIHAGWESYIGDVTAGSAPLPLNKFTESLNVGLAFQFGKWKQD